MDEKQFIELVAEMRANQKLYFKTRDYKFLNESKRLEKLVDQAIEDYKNPNQQNELGLDL